MPDVEFSKNGTGKALELDICTGPFTGVTAPSGWWTGWSPVRTANQRTETRINWSKEHTGTIRSPSCVTDFSGDFELGSWYRRVRRARSYLWVDYQLVINGAVVLTRTNQRYHYRDKLQDTNPNVIRSVPVDIMSIGTIQVGRYNVPAGAVVELRTRVRDNVNGSQTSAYSRWIGGLRSTLEWKFIPRNLVIGALDA